MTGEAPITPMRLAFFERYLTVWVSCAWSPASCSANSRPHLTASLSQLEFGRDSQVNVPIAVLIWLMIYPMMLKVDFTALGGIARASRKASR